MTNAARDSALRTAKSMAECLCDEIVACAAEEGMTYCSLHVALMYGFASGIDSQDSG